MSIETYPNRPQNNGKAVAGFILLAVGGLLLLKQFTFFFFPSWIFSFPSLLIIIGLYIGAKNNFRNSAWLIMVVIGSIFLLNRIFDGFDLRQFVWPLVLIALGLWFILKRNNHKDPDHWTQKKTVDFSNIPEVDYTVPDPNAPTAGTDNTYTNQTNTNTPPPYGEDFVDSVTVFSNQKKTILSKNFRGGDIVNIFGGSELDLTQADINGRVVLDIVQVFGGLKLIVPPHWQIVSDQAVIFAGVDDKRFNKTTPQSPDKLLVIKGTSIFAGVDIRSY
ncbi:LiaF transmembrane domain-containing protein [Mucilaginibacter lacusdianchii]|uniref:LiaF transmembrane domain-containing protein n=1 Tax=Mucilaginibacter lacusdianchii TaxID=2684211 RepID=UPI00131CA271|nr:DUF5668 domain-containing protein [Mucilaginibacter sp. JXJ CY 39]